MLVLTRKTQQQIQIGDKITITILRVKGNSVRVGIDAPRDERIIRSELHDKPIAPREVEVVTATDSKAGHADLRPIARETECDDCGGSADETVRPLANRVRVLTSQAVRYPQRLSVASLRCALGRR
ncbi:MAG: carbon storage regulator [Planctomycetes bacterium]|nr:carbon storage regulator [Planctomycetota bacterium]